MKVGDTLAVTIQGHQVALAEVVDVNTKENTVELVVPATRVVMGLQVSLAQPTIAEPSTETIITGVDRQTNSSQPQEAPNESQDGRVVSGNDGQREGVSANDESGQVSAAPNTETSNTGGNDSGGNGPGSENGNTDSGTAETQTA